MTTSKKATEEDYKNILSYHTSDQFRKAYSEEYFKKLTAFIEDASNTMYDYHYNNGNISFSRKHPDIKHVKGQLIFSNKCVSLYHFNE